MYFKTVEEFLTVLYPGSRFFAFESHMNIQGKPQIELRADNVAGSYFFEINGNTFRRIDKLNGG